MSEKPAIEDMIPMARRKSTPSPQAMPDNLPTVQLPAESNSLQQIAALKAMSRPNAKGAVNLNLSPELKARLDNAYFATKVPRVQIVTAALEEFLKANGY